MPDNAVFEARQLTKRFGSTTALDNLSLEIPRGSLVGLIGRNGSGKTTLLHHVTGLQLPTSGECRTFGIASGKLEDDHMARIGFVAQDIRLLAWMRVKDHLAYVGSFYERWDHGLADRLREELELDPEQKVGDLSKGDLQKLAVILAVGHRPKLLLLDEPVSNFDPVVRARMLRFLTELLTRGVHHRDLVPRAQGRGTGGGPGRVSSPGSLDGPRGVGRLEGAARRMAGDDHRRGAPGGVFRAVHPASGGQHETGTVVGPGNRRG